MPKLQRTRTSIKAYYRTIEKPKHWREKKAMHHREKSLKKPEHYLCLMIDGMDQKKTCLPHLKRLPKDLNDECVVQMQLVGCLAYNGTIKPRVFITYPNIHNDPNLIVTVIQRVLMN